MLQVSASTFSQIALGGSCTMRKGEKGTEVQEQTIILHFCTLPHALCLQTAELVIDTLLSPLQEIYRQLHTQRPLRHTGRLYLPHSTYIFCISLSVFPILLIEVITFYMRCNLICCTVLLNAGVFANVFLDAN